MIDISNKKLKINGAPNTPLSKESVLFITLDSCRLDTLINAFTPNIKGVAPLRSAQAPSYFTYASHAAMFVGFLPGATYDATPYLNPKYSKVFKLTGAGHTGFKEAAYVLSGSDIINGFSNSGFETFGTSGRSWFDPNKPSGKTLSRGFDHFNYLYGAQASSQVEWIINSLDAGSNKNVFAFLNLSETHVPYYFAGASWSPSDNPCIPFQTENRREECAYRQKLCLEFLDRTLKPLIDLFSHATIVITADHGDCWGEDGLWEHGISHPMTLTVPLIIRIRGESI